MTARAVKAERRRLRARGVNIGKAGRVLAKADIGAHYLRVVEYGATPRVELWETHDRARRARIISIRDLVHLIQNVRDDERSSICRRRKQT